jgi:uridine kinase
VYAKLAAEILDRPPRLGRTRLVCVDGPSGGGKSALAERLAAALVALTEPPVPIVHTDDLVDGWADQFTFWSRLERQVLVPLRASVPGHYRAYDWQLGRFEEGWRTVPPAPVVLLEGVSAARAEIRPEASFTIFVTAPTRLRLARALARDGEALRPYLEIWRRNEERHFAADATADHADLIVDTGPFGDRRALNGWGTIG